ncbi:MAG TPA: hypothetical protein VMW25_00835 [Clostridia bacterium]|nr:hypothetical protein [Clostridia bacterium]
MRKLVKKYLPLLIFLISLSSFTFLFFIQRHFMTNFDEYDHLAAGFLMKNGWRLYRDIFSHHFPFPYYWIRLFTPFWKPETFARTISIFRMSLVVLYLFSFTSIFFGFKNKKSKVAFCLWIIILGIFASLYHGNLILSETFSALAIFSLFWLILPIILGWEKPSFYKSALGVIFSFVGFWTQPLLLILVLLPTLISPPQKKLRILTITLFVNFLPLIYFSISGQLKDFVEEGLWFNFRIYPRYYYELETVYSKSQPLQYLISFIKTESYLLTHFFDFHQSLQFIFNLSIILLAIKVFLKRSWQFSLAFLIILLSSRAREIKIIPGKIFNFGIFPFLTIASASSIILAINYYKKYKLFSCIFIILLIFISSICVRPIVNQSLKPGYNYHVFWSYRQENGEIINTLSRAGEKVLVYPHDVDLYFFAQRQPLDRFLYWFPWINSVNKYRQERYLAIKKEKPPVIYSGDLRFKEDPDYYSQFFPGLLNGYSQIAKNGQPTNIWLRDDLKQRIKAPYSLFTTNKK